MREKANIKHFIDSIIEREVFEETILYINYIGEVEYLVTWQEMDCIESILLSVHETI
jgi:hypothetical protein